MNKSRHNTLSLALHNNIIAVRLINKIENSPKLTFSTLLAIIAIPYATGNNRILFLNPLQNSKGLFEKGVGIVNPKFLNTTNESNREINIKIIDSIKHPLYTNMSKKGSATIKFSIILILFLIALLNIIDRKLFLAFPDRLN
ncbi:hypothetical protein [Ornithobacterium rhinotracheale]|uniref:hypothetical protein n=1 Tax=Ornithobacterium rhinotracheale TaxID=28251 RepID=UPI001FF3BFF1|nr:hypothetical protein [Ornithobacterium rhinotracheale]MCK0195106.1 hypothetical protein [Ornithobacterium rhinotracheale]